MTTKSERTKKHILKTVAPVFNMNGYAGTSLSDITEVTGLTKGAIYGHFNNKEELALQAFNFNGRWITRHMKADMDASDSPLGKMKAITHFYRKYYEMTISFGGCPILNVGIDANHQNPLLLNRVKDVVRKLQNNLAEIITDGIEAGEMKRDLDPDQISKRIFAMIEGSVFMSVLMKSGAYIRDMMDHIDLMIDNEIKL